MNESHINRINELLGESVIYESKKKKTKIKLSLDDGTKKEMDFDGSLNDAKKKYSGKKVKTIRKSKSGDIIGEAVIVSVEELNESKELIPFGYFKITYSDGSSKKTEARAKTAEDFKKYLTQDGNDTVTDEDEDGKETKKKIVKVEKLDEATNSGKKLIKISYEIWDEDSIEAGETDDKGWKDEEGEEFESDEDGTASEKAIKFLKKKDATNASDGSYQSGTWYQDDGDTDMKTGDKKYLAYHLHGSWTPAEKKEIYSGVTNKKINEATEAEKVTFEKPLDIFKWIKDNNQYLYVKQNKDGKYEGSPAPKTKKGSIFIDGMTGNYAVQLYTKVNDDSKKILDKSSLEKFLNIVTARMTKKVNESEETEESFKEKLKKEVVNKFKGLFDMSDKDAFDYSFEKALYWLANDYHSGQNDIWYSILSTSDYKPGRSEKGIDPEEDYEADEIYSYLESKYFKKK